MSTKELIEDIVAKELQGLCSTCTHATSCSYRKRTTKTIIQCELYELDEIPESVKAPLTGLCKNCDNAPHCTLPGKQYGIWHCNEYR